MKTKIIAMYLPQFHSIPENDEFWGKGFTDWVTVKNAKPLFEGHEQPKVPLNNNYYDLSVKEHVAWQAEIAKKYGIYGFGIYHYWFNNDKNLLTKPAKVIHENRDININYLFAWDNISWKRSWDNVKERGNAWAPIMDREASDKSGKAILIPYILGAEKDWENHYNYLLPFFKDERYIKIDNKPMFIIFHNSDDIKKMCQYWDDLSKKDGFNGLFFIFRYTDTNPNPIGNSVFKYEPIYSGWTNHSYYDKLKKRIGKFLGKDKKLRVYDYDEIWKQIIKNAKQMKEEYIYHGGFVSYDDTPRRGDRGIVVNNATISKFRNYLSKLIEISSSQNKDYIFLTAWNEWGEGAMLEPDTLNEYSYLEALSEIVK